MNSSTALAKAIGEQMLTVFTGVEQGRGGVKAAAQLLRLARQVDEKFPDDVALRAKVAVVRRNAAKLDPERRGPSRFRASVEAARFIAHEWQPQSSNS